MFTKTQKVYFGHIDRAGIIYHPHYIDYFHQAYEDFVEELGFDDKNLLADVGVKVPVVNVDVDFRAPVKAGDRLSIEVTVKRLGTSSMTFHFKAREQATSKLVAEGDVVRVTVDKAFQATPIPDRFRAALEKHLSTEA
ncbi:MAG: thioesterase family protein [Candidatus Thermoplasmatota archaeon]|nr:thioesterase family protein [Candidatus Thermoplasmatota archaeon]